MSGGSTMSGGKVSNTTNTAARYARPERFAVRNVTAVLPDSLLEDAFVVVENGTITEVSSGTAPDFAVDGHGAFCLPGLVDTHNDGLEREVMPRPSAPVAADFALIAFESRVRAAGITTLFHGISWENDSKWGRTVEQAAEFCATIAAHETNGNSLIDHRMLHRLDARDLDGSAALRTYLDEHVANRHFGADTPLVSFEDHTPGQGQYTDKSGMVRYIMGTRQLSQAEAEAEVAKVTDERDARKHHRETALEWITIAAQSGYIRLIGHDLATSGEVDDAVKWGAHIAEFPTTLEAARLARDAGLRSVCGAPNVLRGGSHSGNVSARELIALGLCDGLCSDYLPYGMIAAAAVLANERVCTLPQAVRLVSRGPALTVGMEDRGLLVDGYRGDLVLVRIDGASAQVLATHTAVSARELESATP